MDPFCKAYIEIDLASLAVMPTESLSFGYERFMNNSINKMIEEKINDPFLLLKEHFFTIVLLRNKIYEV
jgi:hypothetical protein